MNTRFVDLFERYVISQEEFAKSNQQIADYFLRREKREIEREVAEMLTHKWTAEGTAQATETK